VASRHDALAHEIQENEMNESQHLSSQFDEELARLRTHVLQMGGLVETQVSAAIDAYTTGEVASVKAIVETDRKVNELEKAIDDDCAHVIAKRQPTASDLRLVLGIIKIVTDLERAGDEAKKIAKGVRRIYENGHMPSQYGVGIRHLAEAALSMVRQALDAFARLDTAQAGSVIRADSDVDAEFKSIIRQLITHMMEDPRTITTSIDIITIARAIERIGDHAKNISEQVIYIVEGRDIRHTKEHAK
jgi:phosphate transport system protein